MWFSHLGKLEALQCPKTIEIIADPNYFILSMIKSALWCPNKCRKLKLIAIFVLSNDSGRCSGEKDMPLIDSPFRHRESVRLFTTNFSSSLYLLTVHNICHWEKKGKQNRKREESSEKKSHPLSSLEFLSSLHTPPWQSGAISRKGQWYRNKTGLFRSGSGTMRVTQSILPCLWALFYH